MFRVLLRIQQQNGATRNSRHNVRISTRLTAIQSMGDQSTSATHMGAVMA